MHILTMLTSVILRLRIQKYVMKVTKRAVRTCVPSSSNQKHVLRSSPRKFKNDRCPDPAGDVEHGGFLKPIIKKVERRN